MKIKIQQEFPKQFILCLQELIWYNRFFPFRLIFLRSSWLTYQILQTHFYSKLRMSTQRYKSILCLLPDFLKIISDLINQIGYNDIAINIEISLHWSIKVYLRITFTNRLYQLNRSLHYLSHLILDSKPHSSDRVHKQLIWVVVPSIIHSFLFYYIKSFLSELPCLWKQFSNYLLSKLIN